MNVSNEPLALFATQRYGSRWLLHPSSFETRTLAWLSEPDVTVAWELVKPSEITMRGADDGVRLALSGADASICPVVKGLPAKTALAKMHPEASA